MPPFACPDCRTAVVGEITGTLGCGRCGTRFERTDGIYRFLSAARQAAGERFSTQYRLVRDRDGCREPSPDYYRMLPVVPRTDRRAAEWRIRRESYAHFQQHALPGVWQGPTRILDLGAGNGWLAHRLTSFGLFAVALDRLDDEVDGLGACRHYHVAFPVVQADFDALPFVAGSFDVVVLNGSLHYSSAPEATLREARRMLVAGGALVVMDSPMFARTPDGEQMIEDQRRLFVSEYGLNDPLRAGVGFLTFGGLSQAAKSLGMRSVFVPSRGPMMWRVKRQVGRLRLRRAPASFGVWVAR